MGYMNELGMGTTRDLKLALSYYKRAANGHHSEA